MFCRYLITFVACLSTACVVAEAPPKTDYCVRLRQEITGRKHGFLAGNVAYYVGGFHASWELREHETLGLTHPFHHDLRSRGVGRLPSRGEGAEDTGVGNDFLGWEFYKDTRVLYGSVVVDGQVFRNPVPKQMFWRPDRMVCEYEVAGVQLREEKFINGEDVACTIIRASRPVRLVFDGQSFFGRHSLTSTATIRFEDQQNLIHIIEGGTTRCRPETDRQDRTGPMMYDGMSTVLTASRDISATPRFSKGPHGECRYAFEVECDSDGTALVWSMDDSADTAIKRSLAVRRDPRAAMRKKTEEMNRLLNEQIPWFRCSEPRFEAIYEYLWSLYLMYEIHVGKGWETESHTQTAVNNFLGLHRYDAAFQIRVGAWTADKRRYATETC